MGDAKDKSVPPEKPLPPEIHTLREERVGAYRKLRDDYQAINDLAAARKDVTAADFRKAEETFNKSMAGTSQRFKKALKEMMDSKAIDLKGAQDIGDRYREGLEQRVFAIEPMTHDEALYDAFTRQFIVPAKHHKNTQMDASISSEQELLKETLKNNRGLAVGDFHDHPAAPQFLSRSLKVLKEAGVDTIYLEMPGIADGNIGPIIYTAAQTRIVAKASDGKTNAEKANAAWLYMIAEAQDMGIRIVNIDKGGEARDAELVLSGTHRSPSTGFCWTDAIEADRATLKASGKPEGKFIVFAGSTHFVGSIEGHKGLVDEALGIPVLMMDAKPRGTTPAIEKGGSANGADFYVHGGTDYLDTHKAAAIVDAQKSLSTVELALLPGMSAAIAKLKEDAEKWDKEIKEQYDTIGKKPYIEQAAQVVEVPAVPKEKPAEKSNTR